MSAGDVIATARSSAPVLRRAGVLSVLAALLPLALLVRTWLPVADDLDVPHWDQWEMVPLLDAARAGTLSAEEFYRQDGETRPPVPRLILVALALVTDWDTRAEVVVNLAVGAATVAFLVAMLHLTVRPWSPALVVPLALATSALSFSVAADESFLWGWSLATLTSGAAAACALWAFAWRGRRRPAPWLAALAAVVASFSFTNGLVLLVLVPLAFVVDPRPRASAPERRAPLVAAAICAVAVALYFTGFSYPRALSVRETLAHPGTVARFFLVYLGAPFGALTTTLSIAAGGIGLAVALGAGAWLWIRHPGRRAAMLPWLLLAAFGAITAALAAVGRWRFGIEYPLTSRYQTFAVLFWVAVLVLGALAVGELARGSARRRVVAVAVAGAALCLGAVGYVETWTASRERLRTRVEALRRGRECVVFHAVAPAECLGLIYPDPAVARRRATRLEALQLGPFRPGARAPALGAYPVSDERRSAGAVEGVHVGPALIVNPVSAVYRATEIIVSGRATDPGTGGPARAVLIVVDGTVAGRVRPDADRFSFRFGAFRLAPGPHSIEGYALLADGGIARLAKGWSITVPEPRPAPPRA